MRDLAIAIALVGVAASAAYCTVQTQNAQTEQQRYLAELCDKKGGFIAYGFGGPYCDTGAK